MTHVPFELQPGGILHELRIYGTNVSNPKFHLIPYIPTSALSCDFWVNQLERDAFELLIQKNKQSGNHIHTDFALLMCGIHFPESLFQREGIKKEHLDWMHSLSQEEIGTLSKRVLIISGHFQHRCPNINDLGQIILESFFCV